MNPQLDIFSQPTQQRSYYNTVPESGATLAACEAKAQKQDARVLRFFQEAPYTSFTPAQVFQAFGQQYPIGSIRRAITTLTDRGLLRKTAEREEGIYGRVNCKWILNPNKK